MKFNGKWLPDDQAFRQECLKIAKDLTGFKKNKIYCKYINNDNRSKETAIAFHNHIMLFYPELWSCLQVFKLNDKVGSPTLHFIDGKEISPGTLRFMKVLGDIFFNMDVARQKIVEIGGGYGGQCKTITALYDHVSYTIIDIPESLEVSKAYLNDPSVTFMSCENIQQRQYDLVISDYCISELDEKGIDFYIDSVVNHCKAGYFTCNKIGATEHLIKRLEENFTLRITPEEPKTSKHDNIIIYATRKV